MSNYLYDSLAKPYLLRELPVLLLLLPPPLPIEEERDELPVLLER